MNSSNLIKDKEGNFYLTGPGYLKIKITGSVSEAWDKLQKEVRDNEIFFEEVGLPDENKGFKVNKAFEKSFWLESFVRGVFMMLPLLIGFVLFSFILTSQMTKLAGKIQEVVAPQSSKAAREQLGFKMTLERYRPHIHEIMKIWKEESNKVNQEAKSK
jgi:hypothetical protein